MESKTFLFILAAIVISIFYFLFKHLAGLIRKTGGKNLHPAIVSAIAILILFTSLMRIAHSETSIFEEYTTELTDLTKSKWTIKYEKARKWETPLLKKLPKRPKSIDPVIDIRSYDLRHLSLKDRLSDLMYAEFDTDTKWPKELPNAFNPALIMEMGKNPGLNIRSLHKKGITGKGIGIAIIDTGLIENKEYNKRIKIYDLIHSIKAPQMHSSAVSSIAVGQTTGVAPEADLYFISCIFGTFLPFWFDADYNILANAVDRIIEINKVLPTDNKIRVISISKGWRDYEKGAKNLNKAVERAKKENIFVVSCSLERTYGFYFHGLGREPLKDPDKSESYEPGLWWSEIFFKTGAKFDHDTLLVPMDSRTIASPVDKDAYLFSRSGGWSWAVPYIASVYALACQVNPGITPDVFWREALKTGDTIQLKHENKSYSFGKIINPVKLMENIKKL